jgi:hypothetical protein
VNAISEKTTAIHRLLAAVASAYGPDAFPVDDRQPDDPATIVLTSACDRRFLASVVMLQGSPERFSVMVELYAPPDANIIPFEIAADGEYDLLGVVELLGRYRESSRA